MWKEESQTASYIYNPVLDSGNTQCWLVWQCRSFCKKTRRVIMGNNVGQLIDRRGVFSLVCCALRTAGFSLPARMQTHVLKMLAWVWVKGFSGRLRRHAVWICTIKFLTCKTHVTCRNGFLSWIYLFILFTDWVEVSEKSWGIQG